MHGHPDVLRKNLNLDHILTSTRTLLTCCATHFTWWREKLQCKGKQRYLLPWKVSSYCCLPLHCSTDSALLYCTYALSRSGYAFEWENDDACMQGVLHCEVCFFLYIRGFHPLEYSTTVDSLIDVCTSTGPRWLICIDWRYQVRISVEPDICHRGRAYIQCSKLFKDLECAVMPIWYCALHCKEPLKSLAIRVGHSPGFGSPAVARLP